MINKKPKWITGGKAINELIKELESFSDGELEVKVSIDGGKTYKCNSLVVKDRDGSNSICGSIKFYLID